MAGTEPGGVERSGIDCEGEMPAGIECSSLTDTDAAVVALLRLLGKAHTMAILYVFARDPGPWRFGELEALLDVSPNTLTERLRELVSARLLAREAYAEIPPRVEYRATEKADDLKPAFAHLYAWAWRHELGSDTEERSGSN